MYTGRSDVYRRDPCYYNDGKSSGIRIDGIYSPQDFGDFLFQQNVPDQSDGAGAQPGTDLWIQPGIWVASGFPDDP